MSRPIPWVELQPDRAKNIQRQRLIRTAQKRMALMQSQWCLEMVI
jgi:hypothetical protein